MKKILIIDDEEIVRMSCERALQVEGFQTGVASSGICEYVIAPVRSRRLTAIGIATVLSQIKESLL